VTRKKSHVKKW